MPSGELAYVTNYSTSKQRKHIQESSTGTLWACIHGARSLRTTTVVFTRVAGKRRQRFVIGGAVRAVPVLDMMTVSPTDDDDIDEGGGGAGSTEAEPPSRSSAGARSGKASPSFAVSWSRNSEIARIFP